MDSSFVRTFTDFSHGHCLWTSKNYEKKSVVEIPVIRRMSDTDPGNAEMHLVNPHDIFKENSPLETAEEDCAAASAVGGVTKAQHLFHRQWSFDAKYEETSLEDDLQLFL